MRLMIGPIFSILLVLCSLRTPSLTKEQKPTAGELIRDAKTQTKSQNKSILVIFGALWCGPCKQFDAFLDDERIRPIVESRFVIVHVTVAEEVEKHGELNTVGGEDLMVKQGGATGGLPYLVILDAKGNAIITSNRPVKDNHGGGNIGYPANPEEISWFITMLHKGAPSMAAPDAQFIEEWLTSRIPR
jgi:thioredoxin-related protein